MAVLPGPGTQHSSSSGSILQPGLHRPFWQQNHSSHLSQGLSEFPLHSQGCLPEWHTPPEPIFLSLHAQEHALKACFWEHQPELIWCLYIDVLPTNPSIREFSPTFSPFHFHCPDLCDIASSRHTSMLLWLLKLVLYRFGGQKWDVGVMGKQPANHWGANLLRRTVALCCSQSPSSSLAEAVKLEERIHFPLTIMITQTMGKKNNNKKPWGTVTLRYSLKILSQIGIDVTLLLNYFPHSSHHHFHFGQIKSESADFHPGADRHFDILEETAAASLTNEIRCSTHCILLALELILSLANYAA